MIYTQQGYNIIIVNLDFNYIYTRYVINLINLIV